MKVKQSTLKDEIKDYIRNSNILSPEECKSVKRLKLHKYDNNDDDKSTINVNSVSFGTDCHFHVK